MTRLLIPSDPDVMQGFRALHAIFVCSVLAIVFALLVQNGALDLNAASGFTGLGHMYRQVQREGWRKPLSSLRLRLTGRWAALHHSRPLAADMADQQQSAGASAPDGEGKNEKRQAQQALPAPGEGASQLDVSGEGDSVKLDHLGPMVVNSDGTLSRITNWDQMTDMEKANTLRVLKKRNKLRLDSVRQSEESN